MGGACNLKTPKSKKYATDSTGIHLVQTMIVNGHYTHNTPSTVPSTYLVETACNSQVTSSKGQHFVILPSPVRLTVEQAYVITLEIVMSPTIAKAFLNLLDNQDKD